MFNSGRRGKRAPDGYGTISVNEQFNQSAYPIPIIDSYAITDGSYVPYDDLALNTAGGQTIVIYGSGFKAGISVNINGTNRTTTLLDSNRLVITSPALSSGTYTIYASNTDGATAIYVPGLIYSGTPTWVTSSNLGSNYETKAFSQALSATSDSSVTYSLQAGSTLPSGVTLTSGGSLSGTLPAESGSTTYQFTIVATDAELQDTTRQFSLTVNTDVVTWVTPSSNYVISSYEYGALSNVTANATSAAGYGVLYSANTLPTGASLNTSSGLISGTINTIGNTYSRLTATANTTNRSAVRDVIFNVNQDVVTWTNPSSDTSYSLNQGTVMSNVTLSATSAAGFGVQYSANALPTGVSLSGSTISGTPSSTGTTYTQLTATANTTSRVAYRYITWTISIAADTYFPQTTLLLSANSSTQTSSFVADNSINNAQLTVTNDARTNNFNPYQPGYYGVQFTGTVNDYISIPHNPKLSIMSGDTNTYIAECFVYWNVVNASMSIMDKSGRNTVSFENWSIRLNASKQFQLIWGASGSPGTSAIGTLNTTIIPVAGKWYHVALVKSNADWSLFVDGTRQVTYNGLNTANDANPAALRVGLGIGGEGSASYMNGYVSNVRVYNGPAANAPYSATSTTLTVPTSPFLDAANTGVITCNSARYLDTSSNSAPITAGSTVKISSLHPYTTVYQAGTPYYSTYFNGTTDYLTFNPGTSSQFGTGDFTVECWIFPTAALTTQYIVDMRDASHTTGFVLAYGVNVSGRLTWYNQTGNLITENAAYTQLNQWNHIAFCRNSGVNRLFVNGVMVNISVTDSTNYNNTNTTAYIGSRFDINTSVTSTFPGYISNLRIVKGTAIYTTSGTTQGYTAFTPPTAPLTAVANTVLLTCQDPTLKDNSTNNFTITQGVTTVKPVAVSPFTPSSYSNTAITTYGSAYFDGTGDSISLPASPAFTFGTGDFTIEFWIYSASATAAGFDLRNTISQVAPYIFMLTQTMRWYVSGGYQITSSTMALNTWHHIAVVRSSGVTKMYLNGVQTGSSYTDTNNYLSYAPYIGGAFNSSQMTTGYIADLRVVKGSALYTSSFVPQFTSPLPNVTNTQLLTLQTNGSSNNSTFKDSSSLNNLITRNGNTTSGTFSPYGDNWSVYVPSGNPVLYSSDSSNLILGSGDWTIEAWINLDTVANASQAFYIFSNRRVNNATWDNGPMACITNSKLYARDANAGFLTSTPTTFVVGQWYHIAVCRSGSNISCFINGTQEGPSWTTSATYIGNSIRVGYEQQFGLTATSGYVSNLRVIKGQALYTSNFTVSTTPLTSVANTQFLSCNAGYAQDFSLNALTVTRPETITIQKFSPFSTVTVPKYYSTYFDGTGDYLTVPASSNFAFGTGDFTIECWYYYTGGAPGSKQLTLLSNLVSSDNTTWDLQYYSTGFRLASWSPTFGSSSSVTLTAGIWNHIAVTRSGTTLTFWINGVSSGVTTGFSTNLSTSSQMKIGYNGYNDYWQGYISNARIVKGTAVYTSGFTPSTTRLTAVANTSLLTCQDSTFKDNSTNAYTVTGNGDAKPLPVSPFTQTANSASSYSPTSFGGSMYFDGTGDYLSTPYNVAHDINSGDFTVEAWVYRNVSGAEHNVFVTRSSAGTDGWNLRINTTNTLQFYFTGGGTQTSVGTIPAGTWTHVAATKSGNTLRLFINGVIDGVNAAIGTGTTNTGATLRIGVDNSSAAGYMNGYISDARIIKGGALYTSNFYPGATPLTPTDMIGTNTYSSTLLLSGASPGIIDQTRTVNLESVADAKVAKFSPYNGSNYSYYFDGNLNTYLQIPTDSGAMDAPGDFTMEFWFYMLVAPTDNNTYGNLYGNNGVSNTYMIGLLSSGYLATTPFYIHMLIAGDGAKIMSDNPVDFGKWYHVAHTRTAGVNRLFVNGVLQTTTYTESTSRTYGTSPTYIAKNFGGYISNFRYIKGTSLYTATFTPSTSPLTTVSNTSLLTCQTNQFKDSSTNNLTVTKNGTMSVRTQNPFQVNSGTSYYFDGTGDYLTTHTASGILNFGTGDFTMETWVHFTASNATYNPFLRLDAGTCEFGYDWSTSQLKYNTNIAVIAASYTFVVGQWYHIAVVRNAGVAKMYVNGNIIGSTSGFVDSYNHNYMSTSSSFRIGGSSFSTSHVMYGYLSDLRVTKYARYTSNNTTYLSSGPYMTK